MFAMGNAPKNQLIDEHAENKYYTTDYKIDINNKNDTKSIIANHISKGAICLDVGCSAGFLGKMLSKYRDATVYGIEIDKEAIKYAHKIGGYVDLYNFSVTERNGKEYNRFLQRGIKFDYIIMADLLEHVVCPDDVLLFFADFLKPNGKFIISLPNVAHFDIARGLIDRKFNYNNVGLLDNTHLRFYTEESFGQFIQQLDRVYKREFRLKKVGKTTLIPDYVKDYPKIYEILNQDDEACTLQYIYEIYVGKNRKKDDVQLNNAQFFDKIEEAIIRQDEVEKLKRKIAKLEKGMNEIYSSTSWKITKPMRKIASVFVKK